METIAKIETMMLPKIDKFSGDIDHFEETNKKTQEVVQSLDYNLSLKVNKSNLVILEKSWDAKYCTKDDNELINT
jgi:hypothetical protein